MSHNRNNRAKAHRNGSKPSNQQRVERDPILDFLRDLGRSAGISDKEIDEMEKQADRAAEQIVSIGRQCKGIPSREDAKKVILISNGINPTPFATEHIAGTDLTINVYKGNGIKGVVRELKGHGDVAEAFAVREGHGISAQQYVVGSVFSSLYNGLCEIYRKGNEQTKPVAIDMLNNILDLQNLFVNPEDETKYHLKK